MSTWSSVASQLSSQAISSLQTYNNKVYGGTNTGGRLFEWNDTDAWVQVAPQLNSLNYITSLTTYNNKLYGGASYTSGQASRLFEWNDTDAWVSVGVMSPSSYYSDSTEVHNSELYMSGHETGGSDSLRLYKWNDVDTLIDLGVVSTQEYRIRALKTDGTDLYIGTREQTGVGDGGELYKYDGSTFTKVATPYSTENRIHDLEYYKGKIYASTGETGRLLEFDSSGGQWVSVAPALNSVTNLSSLKNYNDKLVCLTSDGRLYEWNDTDAWVQRAAQILSSTIRDLRLATIKNNILYAGTNQGRLLELDALPFVNTDAATSITANTATLNGEVVSDNGFTITERGFAYNTTGYPNIIDDTKVAVGGTIGIYDYDLTGLDADTTYYFVAYATNSEGTGYGEVLSFTTSTAEEVLDFQIEINSTDYTDKADMKTIRWTNYENFSNTADAFFIDDTNFIKMGMELIIRRKSDSKIVFGGLIQKPKKVLLSPNFLGVKVHAESYKQILGRRTFELNVQNQLAGTTVQGIFDDYLKVGGTYTDEELTLGNIDDGITIENYVKRAQSGLKLFNDLADASDYKWWITNEKEFYFQANPTYTDNTTTKKLTPNKSDSAYIKCIDLPDYDEDSSNFRTRQTVVGKKIDGVYVIGSYIDTTAETEMATRYGSGVFGSVIENDNISTTAEANALAQSEVETYVNPDTIRFKTTDFIEPLELIKVDIAILGISDETYKVTSVSYAFDNDVRIVCDVTCEKYVVTNKPKRTWTDEFNTMIKDNSNQEQLNDLFYSDNAGIVNLAPAVPYLSTITHILDKDKALHCHYSIVGVSAGAGTVTVTFDINTVVQKTFTFDVVAGNFAKTLAYPIRGIATSGSATVDASTTSTVAIAIAINDLNFWVNNQ